MSDPSVVAYHDSSSSTVPLAASVFLILKSPSSPPLVTGLVLVSFFLETSTSTATCVCTLLPVFPVASCQAFSSSSISSRTCYLPNSTVHH